MRLVIRMLSAGANQGTDDGKLVRHRGKLRQVLANLHAADVCRNRLEQPAKLSRGTGLQVKNILVARSPREMHIDDGLCTPLDSCFRLSREQLWEREASQG